MRLRVIHVTTEHDIEFVFSFLIRSDGTEVRIPLTLETDERVEVERGRLPA
jgi:hypothetical protein